MGPWAKGCPNGAVESGVFADLKEKAYDITMHSLCRRCGGELALTEICLGNRWKDYIIYSAYFSAMDIFKFELMR